MSEFASRIYRGDEQDTALLLRFLGEIALHPRYVMEFHPGDLVYRLYAGYVGDMVALNLISIWTDPATARIAAIGWFYKDDNELGITLDPALSGTSEGETLVDQLIDWSMYRSAALKPAADIGLAITLLHSDQWMQSVLGQRGFADQNEPMFVGFRQSLEHDVPAPDLPSGLTFRDLTGEEGVARRVELHNEIWPDEQVTVEDYGRLLAAPIYRPDLDLFVTDPDGRAASYCHTWFDPVSRTGLFEPVGARSEYRRMGLTSALLYEAMRRLRSLGATAVYVGSLAGNDAANRLYESVGFTRIADWRKWQRPAPLPE